MYDDYTSIHGICFDEGQSGNCGYECRGFLNGDCDIPDEIIENCKSDFEEVLIDEYGELRLAVMRAQTKIHFNEHKILMGIFGYLTNPDE